MNLFFEESGDFKVGTVLSQAGEAYQVEMASGKRTKVKVKDVLLQYEKPAPAELLEQAKSIAAEIDLDFLWEVAGEDEFGFAELGAEYFGHAPLPPEAAGLILALHYEARFLRSDNSIERAKAGFNNILACYATKPLDA